MKNNANSTFTSKKLVMFLCGSGREAVMGPYLVCDLKLAVKEKTV